MPYLEYLYCENCKYPHNLDLDYLATVREYQKDKRPSPQVNSATIVWDYMIYSCVKCKKKFKFTFRDVESLVRKHLSSLGHKYEMYLDELSEHNDTEEARKNGDFFRNKDQQIKNRISNLYGEG